MRVPESRPAWKRRLDAVFRVILLVILAIVAVSLFATLLSMIGSMD